MQMIERTEMIGRVLLTATLIVLATGDRQLLATDIASPATINAGSDPRLELNQTGVGVPAYKWTMNGNEVAYTITDTATSLAPFAISAGAPYATLHLHANGYVGIGTTTAQRELHIVGHNAPAIRLEQTNLGGFPARTWGLEANDLNFMIHDVTGNRRAFKVQSGAPNDTMYLQNTGKVGMGTSSPGTKLHLVDVIESPRIRFEEATGTPYIWDLLGDHAGFDVVDVTTGHTPLAILPGAPTNSMFVNSSGNLGLGTSSPATALHIHKLSQAATPESLVRFQVGDDAAARLEINNASSSNGVFIPRIQGRASAQNASLIMEGLIGTDVGSGPAIVYNVAKSAGGAVATRPLVVYRNNNAAKVTISANGNVTATAFVNASSREFKDKITDLSSDKASAALRQLTPVEFVYKDDTSADPRIGFIAEDVPDLIAEPERKSVPVMDVVAVLTKVVKDQDRQLQDQEQQLTEERQRNDRNEKLLLELTRQVTELKQRASN